MSLANTTGIVSIACTQALGQYLRVKPDVTYGLGLAGATDEELGTVDTEFVITGLGKRSTCPVLLVGTTGLHYMIASEPIAANGDVYAAASGKVASSGTVRLGKTLDAATADGDIIRVARYQSTQVSTTGTTATTWTADTDGATPKMAIAADAAGTGDYTATIKAPATLTANRTLRAVDADDTLVTLAATQTLTNKTLTSPVITESMGASTSAAGSTSADAGALPAGTARVYPTTAADDTVGVRIHASDKVTARMLFIGNGVANKILKVYAPAGGTINGGSANAAFSTASGKGAILFCTSSGDNSWLAW